MQIRKSLVHLGRLVRVDQLFHCMGSRPERDDHDLRKRSAAADSATVAPAIRSRRTAVSPLVGSRYSLSSDDRIA